MNKYLEKIAEQAQEKKKSLTGSIASQLVGGIVGGHVGETLVPHKYKLAGDLAGSVAGAVLGDKLYKSAEKHNPNYLIPAMTAGVPVAAMGAARQAELAIRERHAKVDDLPMYKELRKGNLRTALALTGAAGVAAAGAEAYRQHMLDEKQKAQTKNIQTAIKRVVENQ